MAKPTLKQKRVAKIVLEGLSTGQTAGEALRKAGYGPGMIHNPQQVMNSVGFKAAMAEFGLTEELISTALVDDIKAKPKQRVQELKLGAEILGMTHAASTNVAVQVNMNEDRDKYA